MAKSVFFKSINNALISQCRSVINTLSEHLITAHMWDARLSDGTMAFKELTCYTFTLLLGDREALGSRRRRYNRQDCVIIKDGLDSLRLEWRAGFCSRRVLVGVRPLISFF